MEEHKLKPCPFCGGVATDWFCTSNGLYVTKFYNQRLRGLNATHSIVFCNKCGCRTKVYLRMENAHKAWNRRMKMAGLIEANALIRDINADIYRTESEKSYDRCLVYRQPTVDAVEVVRCKNCKHWSYEYDCVGLCTVDVPDIDGVQREDFDFCSYGERKDGGGNG